MNIDTSRSFAVSEVPPKLIERAREWATREKWEVLSQSDARLVVKRGGGIWSWFTFDIRKLPTTVTVEVKGNGPYEATVRYEVKSGAQAETADDRKRVEEQLELIVAKVKGAV